MRRTALLFCLLLLSAGAPAQPRWHIADGGKQIRTDISDTSTPHFDHIEMSGESLSCVLRWGVDGSKAFHQERTLIFPMLRTIPDDTHASLTQCVSTDIVSLLSVDGWPLTHETVEHVVIDGTLRVASLFEARQIATVPDLRNRKYPGIGITRTFFPSTTKPAFCELYEVKNLSKKRVTLCIPDFRQQFTTSVDKGVEGSYTILGEITGSGTFTLEPQQTVRFGAVFQACRKSDAPLAIDPKAEYDARMAFIDRDIDGALVLETPDSILNTQFRYAKIRAAESIFRTSGGLMHAPGGERFYAAVWANDQAEYINPFFPFMGYATGNESALNAFRHFARFTNDEYRMLPSSIIAQGREGYFKLGDRGDAAMVAYGAARYALARGDIGEARELWPLIEWCLEFCRRKVTADGIVASDTDELEGRFPAGKANLCTSTLYYDALTSAVMLGRGIGVAKSITATYSRQAASMRQSIERYFGKNVGGYDTYRYFDGCTLLRSWICIPLTAGIFDRADQTVKALFGPELMSPDGVLTQQGSNTFWDRSTLYALRGAFMAGYPDQAAEYLKAYSARRLLGDHVPYAVEAYPEGAQRHLSTENALYCRIFTEGLFGIRPTGLRSFDLTPHIPSGWNSVSLRNIRAFGSDFSIRIHRTDKDLLSVVIAPREGTEKCYTVKAGETIKVQLQELKQK